MQGYEARLGLGITRIKNHTVEPMPIMKNAILVRLKDPRNFFILRIMMLVLGGLASKDVGNRMSVKNKT
jgi:hypothetical protein